MPLTAYIILLIGTSSASKSSLARELQAILPEHYLLLGLDDVFRMVSPRWVVGSDLAAERIMGASLVSAVLECSMAVPLWNTGDPVAWRSRPQGRIGYVIPLTVVVDTPTVTVLFQAPGSTCKRRAGQRGGPRGRGMLIDGWDGTHEDRLWSGPPNHRLYQWGTAHTIIRTWNTANAAAEGWYINLEAPWRRTSIGFDTHDLVLDITVADDLSSWAWKDEDELDWSVSIGTLSRADAAAIRAEGLRVIQAIERRAWPFQADWSVWRPDPQWPIPALPPNWADDAL